MENPFVYGEVVPAAAFVNRVLELDRLVGDLASSQKIFLISPRRYGKSSLIHRALASMEKRGALTVEVTVASFSSDVAFLEGYPAAPTPTLKNALAGFREQGSKPLARCGLRHLRASAISIGRPCATLE